MNHPSTPDDAPFLRATVDSDADLIARHLALYGVVRKALVGLAETVPWDSPVDYDVVLESVDALHTHLDLPSGECAWAVSKHVLFDAACDGLTALVSFGIPADELGVCRNLLDAVWELDPDTSGHHLPHVRTSDGAR